MAGGDGCWMRPVWGRDRGLQALRRLAAPRWRRQVDRAGEVELDLEQPPARPRELVEETLARLDLHPPGVGHGWLGRSEEHTSELPSLMRPSSAVFCLTKK